jgi:hypothetical protein
METPPPRRHCSRFPCCFENDSGQPLHRLRNEAVRLLNALPRHPPIPKSCPCANEGRQPAGYEQRSMRLLLRDVPLPGHNSCVSYLRSGTPTTITAIVAQLWRVVLTCFCPPDLEASTHLRAPSCLYPNAWQTCTAGYGKGCMAIPASVTVSKLAFSAGKLTGLLPE